MLRYGFFVVEARLEPSNVLGHLGASLPSNDEWDQQLPDPAALEPDGDGDTGAVRRQRFHVNVDVRPDRPVNAVNGPGTWRVETYQLGG